MKKTILLVSILTMMNSSIAAHSISGIVRDATNGESMPGVSIRIQGTNIGTVTNIGGFYSIQNLSKGRYVLRFSVIGYESVEKKSIIQDENVTLNIYLKQSSFEFNEIIVQGERERQKQKMTIGEIKLSTRQLQMVPGIAEPDLFRAIQQLPGVLSASDYTTGLHIWGGSPDQNLITLDGIDVYNPSHLGGLFSTFNMDAIKEATLIKGGYPAEFGGRLSSVLSVWNKEGNREEVAGRASVSVLSSSATLEGPYKYGSWLISGRRTYLDLFTKALKKSKAIGEDLPYYFYDAQGKVNRDFKNGDQLSISGYLGRDRLNYQNEYNTKANINWGNKTVSLPYVKILNPKFYTRSMLAASWYDSSLEFEFSGDKAGFSNGITDYTAKFDVHHFPTQKIEVKFGQEAKRLNFKLRSFGQDQEFANINESAYLTAIYLQAKLNPTAVWSIQPGIRYTYYNRGDYNTIEPRMSVKFRPTALTAFTFAMGRYHQFINLASIGGGSGFLSIIDIWIPLDETLPPGRADHFTFSYETELEKNLRLETAAYYKDYQYLVEYKNTATDDNTLKSQFFEGNGWAYGIDFLLRRDIGDWTGWLGYGFGISKRKFVDVDSGRSFYPKWDRRNVINLVNSYKISPRAELNLRWTYGTGQPFTIATGRYRSSMPDDVNPNRLMVGRKNNSRLSPYHRMDVSYSIKYQKSWGTITPYIEIINLYNRTNIFTIEYDFERDPPNQTKLNQLPLLPTIGVNATF